MGWTTVVRFLADGGFFLRDQVRHPPCPMGIEGYFLRVNQSQREAHPHSSRAEIYNRMSKNT